MQDLDEDGFMEVTTLDDSEEASDGQTADDADLRAQALELAIQNDGGNGNANSIVANAKRFLTFLKGEQSD